MKRPAVCGVVICLVLWFEMPAAAGDWPQFRGPDGAGSSSDGGFPTRWSRTENIRWRIQLPGRGLSCPVVAAGRVYLTACSGYEQRRLHVLCYEAATGKQQWERQFAATGSTMCHPTTCMAAPTPVTDGDRVYALFATGDLACIDKAGYLIWYRSLVGDYPTISNQVGLAASPILWGDVLLLPMENAGQSFIAGLDKHTGENLWKVPRGRGINWVTPQIVKNGSRVDVLFQTGAETTAYDPQTGHKRWANTSGGRSSVVSPLVAEDLVLIPAGGMSAVRLKEDGKSSESVWTAAKLRTSYASPLYYAAHVYVINDVGVLTCAEGRTGKVLWQERVMPGPFWASPLAAEGRIYLVNDKGMTAVVQTGDKPRILARNESGESILATPAMADGCIFLRSDEHLLCIGPGPKP